MSRHTVWISHPPKSIDKRIQLLIKSIASTCVSQNWGLELREYQIINNRGVISGQDSHDLYQKIHRSRTAVVSIQPPNAAGPILFDRPIQAIRGRAIDFKKTISLRQFCINKAYFYKMRWDRNIHNWDSGFHSWTSRTHCEGILDPICLPFPVFCAEDHWPKSLRFTDSRRDFNHQFGTNDRLDLRKLIWKTREMHGTEIVNIAGFNLPRGYHWNVNSSLGLTQLFTPTEIWEINSYVNVTPDACIRGRLPFAKRIK
jgi:hypothetical protein